MARVSNNNSWIFIFLYIISVGGWATCVAIQSLEMALCALLRASSTSRSRNSSLMMFDYLVVLFVVGKQRYMQCCIACTCSHSQVLLSWVLCHVSNIETTHIVVPMCSSLARHSAVSRRLVVVVVVVCIYLCRFRFLTRKKIRKNDSAKCVDTIATSICAIDTT